MALLLAGNDVITLSSGRCIWIMNTRCDRKSIPVFKSCMSSLAWLGSSTWVFVEVVFHGISHPNIDLKYKTHYLAPNPRDLINYASKSVPAFRLKDDLQNKQPKEVKGRKRYRENARMGYISHHVQRNSEISDLHQLWRNCYSHLHYDSCEFGLL
jgi:hypothetical protein